MCKRTKFDVKTFFLLFKVGMLAPVIETESPVNKNKKCRNSEEATEGSHRSAQAFCFYLQACSGKREMAPKKIRWKNII